MMTIEYVSLSENGWAKWDAEHRHGHIPVGSSVRAARANKGGFSLNAEGKSPTSGFMVSYADDMGGVEHVVSGNVSSKHIAAHEKAAGDLLKDPHNFQGAWKDSESGKTYLDVSKNVPDIVSAAKMAKQHHQLAIYDVAGDRAINTDDALRMAAKETRRGRVA